MTPRTLNNSNAPVAKEIQVFDLIVIGSGPGGQKAALQGAKAGKKVAIIQSSESGEGAESAEAVGGGCIFSGTIPSKSFRESVYRYSLGSKGALGATLGREYEHHESLSKKKVVTPKMERLLRRRDRVVKGESQVIRDQLERNGIKIFFGHGKLKSAHEVEVTQAHEKRVALKAEVIILAVGARPMAPEHLSVDGKWVHDSNTILSLKKVPKSMVVLGAGIIGCEYASIFGMAGTRVTLVDRRHEILASVDREIVHHLIERFNIQGTKLLLGTEATALVKVPDKRQCKVQFSRGKKPIQTEVVLVAQGRVGNIEGLGLRDVGVEHDERGLIRVNATYQTAVPSIYAVGDVIGAPALASTSMEQGRIAVCHAFQLGEKADQTPSSLFPYGIYTIPEISMIGRTEEELKSAGVDYVAGKARYWELARGQIVGDKFGILKLLVERRSYRIVGVHIIGDNAADLIHIGQAVMAHGGDVHYFIRSVFNYPTLAEAYKTAAFHAVNLIKGTTQTRY